jgi:hypothetical protein
MQRAMPGAWQLPTTAIFTGSSGLAISLTFDRIIAALLIDDRAGLPLRGVPACDHKSLKQPHSLKLPCMTPAACRNACHGADLPSVRQAGNGRLRRISPIAVRPGEGLLSDHIAGAQPWRRELVFFPHLGHSPIAAGLWQ